jgi:hypothetical protein
MPHAGDRECAERDADSDQRRGDQVARICAVRQGRQIRI